MTASFVIIGLSVFLIMAVLWFYVFSLGKYKDLMKPLNKKDYAFSFMLPAGLYFIDKVKYPGLGGNTRLRQSFAELYGEKYAMYYLKIHTANKISTAMICVLVLSAISLNLNVQSLTAVKEAPLASINGNIVTRPQFNPETYKNSAPTVSAQAEIDDNGKKTVQSINVKSYMQAPDDKTCVDMVIKDLEKNYIQAYKDQLEGGIASDLNFAQFGVQLGCGIVFKTEEEQGYLSEAGVLTRPGPEITEPLVYSACFVVSKGDISGHTSYFNIKVLPAANKTEFKTDPAAELNQYIQNLNNNPNTANNDPIVLPKSIGTATITYSQIPEPADNTKYLVFVSIIFAVALIFILLDRNVDESIKKKRERIKYDFPDFVNKYALLLGCGLTTYDAFLKIMTDNKDIASLKTHPIYMELETTIREIDLGKAEVHAYEDFGLRCRITEAMKFSSLVAQNLRRGTNDLLMQLKEQVADVWQMHKAEIRRRGEEAGTLMMLPMILSLVSVLLVVIYPAFSALKF